LLRHVFAVQYDVLLIICHAVNTADNEVFIDLLIIIENKNYIVHTA